MNKLFAALVAGLSQSVPLPNNPKPATSSSRRCRHQGKAPAKKYAAAKKHKARKVAKAHVATKKA